MPRCWGYLCALVIENVSNIVFDFIVPTNKFLVYVKPVVIMKSVCSLHMLNRLTTKRSALNTTPAPFVTQRQATKSDQNQNIKNCAMSEVEAPKAVQIWPHPYHFFKFRFRFI